MVSNPDIPKAHSATKGTQAQIFNIFLLQGLQYSTSTGSRDYFHQFDLLNRNFVQKNGLQDVVGAVQYPDSLAFLFK